MPELSFAKLLACFRIAKNLGAHPFTVATAFARIYFETRGDPTVPKSCPSSASVFSITYSGAGREVGLPVRVDSK